MSYLETCIIVIHARLISLEDRIRECISSFFFKVPHNVRGILTFKLQRHLTVQLLDMASQGHCPYQPCLGRNKKIHTKKMHVNGVEYSLEPCGLGLEAQWGCVFTRPPERQEGIRHL